MICLGSRPGAIGSLPLSFMGSGLDADIRSSVDSSYFLPSFNFFCKTSLSEKIDSSVKSLCSEDLIRALGSC